MKGFWLPVATLWQRDLIRFWREKARVLGFVGSPLLFWVLIGSGFGNLGFFFPGALVLTVMFSAVFSTMSLIEDRREGFLLSMLVSPAPRSSMVLGKILGSSTLAWIQGALFLCFLPMTGYAPGAAGVLEAAAIVFLISFTFTVLGFLIAWQMDSTQGFHAIMNLVLVPLWMVSGALFPMASAHGWVRLLMKINPVTYMVAALRQPLENNAASGTPGLPLSLLVTAACAAVLFAASAASATRRSVRSFA
jgi:ABC-2 type transport system permease protein